jgi:hypothetical protein
MLFSEVEDSIPTLFYPAQWAGILSRFAPKISARWALKKMWAILKLNG